MASIFAIAILTSDIFIFLCLTKTLKIKRGHNTGAMIPLFHNSLNQLKSSYDSSISSLIHSLKQLLSFYVIKPVNSMMEASGRGDSLVGRRVRHFESKVGYLKNGNPRLRPTSHF